MPTVDYECMHDIVYTRLHDTPEEKGLQQDYVHTKQVVLLLQNNAPALGFCKLRWHNFEHYRDVQAFENNASIIGLISKHYWTNFTANFKPSR